MIKSYLDVRAPILYDAGACFSYRKVRIVRNLQFVNLGTFLRRSVIAFLEALRK